MEQTNFTGRPIGNNGYRLLPMINNNDYDCAAPCNSHLLKHSDCPDFFTDSSGDDDSFTDGSDKNFCDDGDMEKWQKKIDSKGELFYVQTYTEDVASQNFNNSSSSTSSDYKLNKVGTSTQDTKPKEIGILSSLVGRHKNSSSKNSLVGSFSKSEGKNLDTMENDNVVKKFIEVNIALPTKRPNLGRGVSTIEGVLGLVFKRIFNKAQSTQLDSLSNESLIIVDIIPDSPASSMPDIHIGDQIVSLNDIEIYFSNLEQISHTALSVECKQVKLGLCRLIPITPKEDSTNRCLSTTSATVSSKLLSGDQNLFEVNDFVFPSSHLILYLNISNCDVTDAKEDVIYQFPKSENKIIKIRGAFITLLNLIPDVVGLKIRTSSLMFDSKLIHIAYATDNGERLMLLALPGDCISSSSIGEVADEITSTLKFQYGTLDQAFKNINQQSQLDFMFALLFSTYTTVGSTMQISDIKKSRSGHRPRLPQQLPLFTDLQICVDTIINEFESSDFADMSEDHYDIRRLYSIIGVSLYYKGFLISNHLSNAISKQVFLYLLHSGMLDTSRQHLTNTIVWKEVFSFEHDGFNNGRSFLLVVGKHHFLLAVFLNTGGCASRAVGPRAPDPFYVQQAQNTLLQLQLHQITTSLNSMIDNPVVSSVAHFKKGHKSSHCCGEKKPETPGSKRNIVGRSSEWHNLDGKADTDSDSTSLLSNAASGTSDDTAPILGRRAQYQTDNDVQLTLGLDSDQIDENQNKSAHRQRALPTFLDLSTIVDAIPVCSNERNTPASRLLTGSQNVLFNYLQISHGQGVLICPVLQGDASDNHWPLTEILNNFESICDMISRSFNSEVDSVIEQAMMFRCARTIGTECTRESDFMTYWVVGKLFKDSSPREVYVCHQDCCPQSLVEIAFRLNYGINI